MDYEIECVRNANGRNIHTYCVGYIGDDEVYIDVRGITTDKELFFEEFKNELTYYAPEDVFLVIDDEGYEIEAEVEIWSGKNELFNGEFEDWDDPDIEKFTRDHAEYYDTACYECVYKCKSCEAEFVVDDEDHDWFNYFGEETLWGHIQLEHPDIFEEYRDLETPDMLELCFDCVIEKKDVRCMRLDDKILGAKIPNGNEVRCNNEQRLDMAGER